MTSTQHFADQAALLAEVRQTTAVDVATAAKLLGIGKTRAYELAATGELPVNVLRIGRRLVVTTASLLRALDVEP